MTDHQDKPPDPNCEYCKGTGATSVPLQLETEEEPRNCPVKCRCRGEIYGAIIEAIHKEIRETGKVPVIKVKPEAMN